MTADPAAAGATASPPLDLQWATVMAESIADLAWAADGGTLYAGCADGLLTGFLPDGEWRFRFEAHAAGITRLCPRPAGDLLATAGEDGRVRLWRSDSGEAMDTLVDQTQWVEHLAWSPDGALLAAAAGRRLHVADATGRSESWEGHPGGIGAIAWAPAGNRLASGANKGVYLWNVGNWEPVRVMDCPGASVSLAWSTDGRALATGTQDGFVHVRLHGPGKSPRLLTMSGYPGKVSALAWHPRPRPDKLVLATCGGSDVVLWFLDRRSGKRSSKPLRGHEASVTVLGWSADGARLLSGDRAGRLCLWTPGGDLVSEMALGSEITFLAWHPTAPLVAAGSVDGTLRLFGIQ